LTLIVNGVTVLGPGNVANALGAFFVEVGNKLADSVGNPAKGFKDYIGSACTKSAFALVYPSEILLFTRNLRGNLASAFNQVHTEMLKAVALSILEPLSCLMNVSLQKDTFPELLIKDRIIQRLKDVLE